VAVALLLAYLAAFVDLAIPLLVLLAVVAAGHDDELLDLHYLLGRAYETLGRKREARREYARVIADSPDFLDAQEHYNTLAPG